MITKIELKLEGLEDVYVKLHDLGGKHGPNIQKKMVNAGSRVGLRLARALLAGGGITSTGTLRRSLDVRIRVYRGRAIAIIGPRSKYRFVTSKGVRWASKYAHLVHGGRNSFKKKNGIVVGAVQARPFLAKAFRMGSGSMVEAMRAKAESELKRLGYA